MCDGVIEHNVFVVFVYFPTSLSYEVSVSEGGRTLHWNGGEEERGRGGGERREERRWRKEGREGEEGRERGGRKDIQQPSDIKHNTCTVHVHFTHV